MTKCYKKILENVLNTFDADDFFSWELVIKKQNHFVLFWFSPFSSFFLLSFLFPLYFCCSFLFLHASSFFSLPHLFNLIISALSHFFFLSLSESPKPTKTEINRSASPTIPKPEKTDVSVVRIDFRPIPIDKHPYRVLFII